ncbi:SIS domain-containing protein [Pseudonocardia sp. HH130630-07]|uniref:SIS domain-containing protein n=1 Tax=Pseudonocardia sp. HH130630-07 TaxID=1690815 RepID=UPI00081520FC|nr:SIS domain-containing protein [Pseudonocardia sp. HH130630-07]ANY07991.1 sugar isomerase [Pseudonocardia sp. HH130630-07]
MSATEREIHQQPDAWLRTPEVVASAAGVLPRDGERIAVLGCGTSWFVAQAYAGLRESAGRGWTDAVTATELPDRGYDRVVAITRSGTTTEVLDQLRRLRGTVPTLALTADAATPVADVADHVVALPFADETSVVQTLFATTAFSVLRGSLGWDVTAVAAAARAALAGPLPDALVPAAQWTFLGTGWSVGLANEAALKLRESCLAWTEAYPAMEYRHGPISIAQPGRVVWNLGPSVPGLADDVAATGATFVEHPDEDPLVTLVRVHRLALAVAARDGLDPDLPRNLTRSVILS